MTQSGNILVSSIGTSDYDEVSYDFDGKTCRTDLSPKALIELVDKEITEALIVRTPEAGEKYDDDLKNTFEEENIRGEFVDIGLITEEADVDAILQTIVTSIREGQFEETSIILDISHSFRTLPLVFLLSLLHLEALEEVTIERIYYSRYAGQGEYEGARVLDLTYLHTMMRWYDALAMARQTGTLRGISALLGERRDDLYKAGDQHREFSTAVEAFAGAQKEIDSGLPLEAGIEARSALDALSKLEEEEFVGPESTVLDPLTTLLDGYQTSQDVKKKEDLTLDSDELLRQARLVDFYRENEKYWIAVECGRELLVNRLLYDAGTTEDWLGETVRRDIAPATGNHEEESQHPISEVQSLWNSLSQFRNSHAHAAHKPDERPSDDKVDRCLQELCYIIGYDEFWKEEA